MPGFDDSLKTTSRAILKRDLSEEEKFEFLELASTIGMRSVEDYLYILMIFKRNEDRVNDALDTFRHEMNQRFEELNALEKQIDDTLEHTVIETLAQSGQKIASNMGDEISWRAKNTLSAHGDFYFLRGQVAVCALITIIATATYFLGAMLGFGDSSKEKAIFFNIIAHFPAGLVALVCGIAYTLFWYCDHSDKIEKDFSYLIILVLQILVLLALLLYMILSR